MSEVELSGDAQHTIPAARELAEEPIEGIDAVVHVSSDVDDGSEDAAETAVDAEQGKEATEAAYGEDGSADVIRDAAIETLGNTPPLPGNLLPTELTLYAILKVTSYESGEKLGLTSQSATETVARKRDETGPQMPAPSRAGGHYGALGSPDAKRLN